MFRLRNLVSNYQSDGFDVMAVDHKHNKHRVTSSNLDLTETHSWSIRDTLLIDAMSGGCIWRPMRNLLKGTRNRIIRRLAWTSAFTRQATHARSFTVFLDSVLTVQWTALASSFGASMRPLSHFLQHLMPNTPYHSFSR